MLEKIIENFNFEEKEAKIYLAALELGKSRVSEIAKKAGLNRITTYEILKRLRQRGLSTSMTYKNVLMFQVIEPERFLERMERQLSLSRALLPQLLLLKASDKVRPKIEYYDGIESLRTMYEDSLFCREKIIYNIAHPENFIKSIGKEFFANYVKKRAAKKIKVKVLLPNIEISKKYVKGARAALREVRFFNHDKYTIPNEIMIYDNKLALFSFSSKIGIIIEDLEITKSIKSIWGFLWDMSKQ